MSKKSKSLSHKSEKKDYSSIINSVYTPSYAGSVKDFIAGKNSRPKSLTHNERRERREYNERRERREYNERRERREHNEHNERREYTNTRPSTSNRPSLASHLWFSIPPNTHIAYDYRCKKGIVTFNSAFVVGTKVDKNKIPYVLVRCGKRFQPLYEDRIVDIRLINKDGAYPKKKKRKTDSERIIFLAKKVANLEEIIENARRKKR